MSSRWINWWSEEDSTATDVDVSRTLEEAHECLRISESEWFRRLMARVEKEALAPVPIGKHEDMLTMASRSNVYKEIRAILLDDVAKAQTFVKSVKER